MVFLHLLISTFPRQTSDLSCPYPRHFDQWWRQSAACYRCLWREKGHRRRVTDMWLLQHRSKSPKGQTWFKVTVHLQGCLAYKQCSASGLNCRYLNPYIKLKLIGLATRLYKKFWKKKKWIVEFFTTSKCKRPNHLLDVTCQSEFCFSFI